MKTKPVCGVRPRSRTLVVALTATVVLALPTGAVAQSTPAWLKVRPSILADEAARQPAARLAPAPPRAPAFMVAVGSGLLASAALAAVLGRKGSVRCGSADEGRHDERIPAALWTGAGFGAAGLTLVLAGAIKLRRRAPHPELSGGPFALAALGTAAAGALVSLIVAAPTMLACSSAGSS